MKESANIMLWGLAQTSQQTSARSVSKESPFTKDYVIFKDESMYYNESATKHIVDVF